MKTKVSYKPEGFHSVTPYLCVNAAAKLLDFLKQAFGAEELGRHPRPDGSIAHACVKIGDSMVELGDVALRAAHLRARRGRRVSAGGESRRRVRRRARR